MKALVGHVSLRAQDTGYGIQPWPEWYEEKLLFSSLKTKPPLPPSKPLWEGVEIWTLLRVSTTRCEGLTGLGHLQIAEHRWFFSPILLTPPGPPRAHAPSAFMVSELALRSHGRSRRYACKRDTKEILSVSFLYLRRSEQTSSASSTRLYSVRAGAPWQSHNP